MNDNYTNEMNVGGVDYDIHDSGRGEPYGVATLDGSGRIPASQLPDTVLELKGTWNAALNIPYLVDGIGTKGDLYFTSVAGDCDFGSGITEHFEVNDRVMYNGTIWQKLSGGGSLTVVDSENALTDEDTFLETDAGAVTTGKRHTLGKLWTWICGKLLAGVPNNIKLTRDHNLKVGNTSWNKDFEVAGNPSSANTNATIGTTNGNVHIDPSPNDDDGSHGTYLNYYRGENGVIFGDGKGTDDSTVARVKGDGTALFPIVNIGNKKPSQFGTYNFGAIFEDDSYLTIETPRASDSGSASVKHLAVKTRGGQWNTVDAGQFQVVGERSDRSAPTTQDIVINGLTNGTSYGQEPGIGFHIPGITFATLKYHNNNEFHFLNSNQNGYVPIKAENAHLPGGLVTHSGRYNPCAAAFVCTDVTVNGFIRILIPVSIMYCMFSFDVNIYEYYSEDCSLAHLTIGGYTYDSGRFYNTSALGYSNLGNLEVHFCPSNGSYFSILINKKDTGRDTTWSYPQVSVNNFLSGYSCVPDSPSPITINFGDVITSPVATYTVPDLHTKENLLRWLGKDPDPVWWNFNNTYSSYSMAFYINLKDVMGSDLGTQVSISFKIKNANAPTECTEVMVTIRNSSTSSSYGYPLVELRYDNSVIGSNTLPIRLISIYGYCPVGYGSIYDYPTLGVGFEGSYTPYKLQLDYIRNGTTNIMDKVHLISNWNNSSVPLNSGYTYYSESSRMYLTGNSSANFYVWRDGLQ